MSWRPFVVFLFVLKGVGALMAKDHKSFDDHQVRLARDQMIRDHLLARGIKDERVLKAFGVVPRHLFFPDPYMEHYALKDMYGDHPLPIGFDQTMSQPYVVGFMTEVLKLKATEKVLEIGTGSGYQAAILSHLVKEVVSIEIVKELGEHALARMQQLNYKNVKVVVGDGYKGYGELAPYDAICVTAAPPSIPLALVAQLKVGGRMIIPVGKTTETQKLILVTKINEKNEIKKEELMLVRFVPMVKE